MLVRQAWRYFTVRTYFNIPLRRFDVRIQDNRTGEITEDAGGVRWESDGIVYRFKSLDMLFSFLHLS